MHALRTLRHPIETVRTAPFGTIVGSVCGVSTADCARILYETNSNLERVIYGAAVAVGGLGTVLGVKIANRQLTLRDRLEEVMETVGYDERALSLTTDEWCTRQTARVVCEKFDVLDQYVELCEARSDTAQLSSIPHI